MTLEKVKTIVEEIIGDNDMIRMPPHPSGIQLEWEPEDWMRVEDVLNTVRKRLDGSGYVLRKNKKHAMIVPIRKRESVATDKRSINAKRW